MSDEITPTEDKDARIEALEKALHLDDRVLATVFKLPPQQANLLGLLISTPLVTTDMVRGLGVANTPKVAMQRLRKRLGAYKISVQCAPRSGYFLSAEDKEVINDAVKAMVAAHQPVPATV